MKEVTQHIASCRSCQEKALQKDKTLIIFGKLNRAGMVSTLCCRCTGCHQDFNFSTSSKVQGMTGGKCWETNLAAVWSQMCTGGGHAPLAETMSRQSFMSTERKICEWWRDLFEESMTLAGKEEKEIAIANNSYHQGVPAVTVIVDGGWSKRTHKHSYNAKSVVAIIMGRYYIWVYVISFVQFVINILRTHLFTVAFEIGVVLLLQWKQTSLLKALKNVSNSMASDILPLLVMEIVLFILAL